MARSARLWGFPALLLLSIAGAHRIQAQPPDQTPAPPPTQTPAQIPNLDALPKLPEGVEILRPNQSPLIPDVAPLPSDKPSPVSSFVEGASQGDGKISVRVGHGRILSLKKDLFAGLNGQPSIAVGDPSIVDFTPVSSRRLRLLGLKIGSTDLSIETADGETITLDVIVGPDLELIGSQLRATFPDVDMKLGQVGDHISVQGQARSLSQVSQIVKALRTSVVMSLGNAIPSGSTGPGTALAAAAPLASGAPLAGGGIGEGAADPAAPTNLGFSEEGGGTVKILNLLRVPTSQQVMLKVRIAELNRTAFRQIGTNFLVDTSNGAIFGTQLGNPVTGVGTTDLFEPAGGSRLTPSRNFVGAASSVLTSSNTLFGIFQNSNFQVLLNALRKNSILKILAEPNLVAYNGHKASFLAGGEFPIPVPQIGATGVASTITVNFKKFGVQLDFLPVILDGETVRLTVDPEVSSIDNSLGTTLIAGGSPVPGLNVRSAHTTVELRQGQTLAIAGLMLLSLDGQTSRLPGLGDLPILGPFFSNTTNNRVEKELVVMVTPYLVEPMNCDQVPPSPGDEVGAPNDLEFYLLNRLEGRTGRDFRATTDGADPLRIGRLIHLEQKNIRGPFGFSE